MSWKSFGLVRAVQQDFQKMEKSGPNFFQICCWVGNISVGQSITLRTSCVYSLSLSLSPSPSLSFSLPQNLNLQGHTRMERNQRLHSRSKCEPKVYFIVTQYIVTFVGSFERVTLLPHLLCYFNHDVWAWVMNAMLGGKKRHDQNHFYKIIDDYQWWNPKKKIYLPEVRRKVNQIAKWPLEVIF